MNSNALKLSESDNKFLMKFQKSVKKIYINYISVGLLACAAIFGVVIGIVRKEKDHFLMAVIFAGMAVILFLISRKYQKLYKIISKLKPDINE
jgi:predicted membrane channel-forming protein YqfA (hemolysin III family)